MGLHQVWGLPIGLLLTRHKVLEQEMSAADKKRKTLEFPIRGCVLMHQILKSSSQL